MAHIDYYTVRDIKNETMVVHPMETIQIISTKAKHGLVIAGTMHARIFKRSKKGNKEIASVCYSSDGLPSVIFIAPRQRFSIDTTRGLTHFDHATGYVYVGLVGSIPSAIEAFIDYECDAPEHGEPRPAQTVSMLLRRPKCSARRV